MTSHRGRLASASALLAISAALWGAFAPAVSAAPAAPVAIDARDLLIRMGRLERDIRDLQAETFRRAPGAPADAPAAPPPRSANAPDLDPIMRRMDEFGDSIGRLTGQMEELAHQVDLLSQKADRLQKEMDYQAQQAGQGGGNPSLSGQPGGAPDDTVASIAPRPSSRALSPSQPSGVLGQIPADAVLPSPNGGSALPPPAADPKNEFDGAMNLLSRAQYDPASQAFRAFVDAHPDDERAPAALYWAGDIAYSAKKDYQEAARNFAELLKRYPMAARAPEGMLKLGLALLELDQMKEGCAALAALPRNIPTRVRRSRRARETSAATTSAADHASLSKRFAAALATLGFTPERSAIAVSGGGDSIALMLLLADWAQATKSAKPFVLIVDHGLRPGSANNAALVKRWAKDVGFSATLLSWRGKKPNSGIEEKARAARYALMGTWCEKEGVQSLFVGHTQDDQAETFLLRLGRGSGVDGLSAMRASGPLPVEGFEAMAVLRPLLGFSRAELRAFLKSRKASWLEDPMNNDPRFARTRVRELLPALEAAGVPAFRIGLAAAHLARAREALETQSENFLAVDVQFEPDGCALLSLAGLKQQPREIALRALSTVLMRVSGETYRPRFERLERLLDALASGAFSKARTLHSCRVGPAPKARAVFGPSTAIVTREEARRSSRKTKKDQKSTIKARQLVTP